MQRKMMSGKIHRATVTGADVTYEGSVTIDADLMTAANLLPNEAVWIWDVDNGARLETYVIPGVPGSGVVCVNGAAARHVGVGDKVIIAAFAHLDDAEARTHRPSVVFVDDDNRAVESRDEHGGQAEIISFRR